MHWIARAFSRACANTGKRIAARMAMMAMTTSSSIRVKPLALGGLSVLFSFILRVPFRIGPRSPDPGRTELRDLVGAVPPGHREDAPAARGALLVRGAVTGRSMKACPALQPRHWCFTQAAGARASYSKRASSAFFDAGPVESFLSGA